MGTCVPYLPKQYSREKVQAVFRNFDPHLKRLHFNNSRGAHLAISGGTLLTVMWDRLEAICGLTGFSLIEVLGRPGGGKTKIIQDSFSLAGIRPHNGDSWATINKYNTSTLYTPVENLYGYPVLFDDAHKTSESGGGGGKPNVDILAEAVYSYSGIF